jgi:hypothetical protein
MRRPKTTCAFMYAGNPVSGGRAIWAAVEVGEDAHPGLVSRPFSGWRDCGAGPAEVLNLLAEIRDRG